MRQPEFPEMVHMKGHPEKGFTVSRMRPELQKDGSVIYWVGKGFELTDEEVKLMAEVLSEMSKKKKVKIDVELEP